MVASAIPVPRDLIDPVNCVADPGNESEDRCESDGKKQIDPLKSAKNPND